MIGRHVKREVMQNVVHLRCDIKCQLKVVAHVVTIEFVEVESIGTKAVDESTECQAIVPACGEVSDIYVLEIKQLFMFKVQLFVKSHLPYIL